MLKCLKYAMPHLSSVPTNERLRLEAGAVSAVMPPPHLAAATHAAAANITRAN